MSLPMHGHDPWTNSVGRLPQCLDDDADRGWCVCMMLKRLYTIDSSDVDSTLHVGEKNLTGV